jgi:hypothetical protein
MLSSMEASRTRRALPDELSGCLIRPTQSHGKAQKLAKTDQRCIFFLVFAGANSSCEWRQVELDELEKMHTLVIGLRRFVFKKKASKLTKAIIEWSSWSFMYD